MCGRTTVRMQWPMSRTLVVQANHARGLLGVVLGVRAPDGRAPLDGSDLGSDGHASVDHKSAVLRKDILKSEKEHAIHNKEEIRSPWGWFREIVGWELASDSKNCGNPHDEETLVNRTCVTTD